MKKSRFIFTAALFGVSACFASVSDTRNAESWKLERTARLISMYPDLGAVKPEVSLTIRVWLKPRNGQKLNRLADEVIDETSDNYGKFLTVAEMADQFYPSTAEHQRVENYLVRKGLTLLANENSALYVAAEGTTSQVESAFQIKLHNFMVHGKIVRSNLADPVIDPQIAPLISNITGLNSLAAHTNVYQNGMQSYDDQIQVIPLDAAVTFDHHCFKGVEKKDFTSTDGKTKATYSGNRFGPDNGYCMYTPTEVQKAYGIDELVRHHLDGTGQTVIVVDAFGSPDARGELDAYSTRFHLPKPELTILQPFGGAVTGAWTPVQRSWAFETSMDVQSIHMMAPGAKIILFEPKSDENSDLDAGLAYVIEKHLGDVVSNSWGDVEAVVPQADNTSMDTLLQLATVQGISFQFASGDSGDNSDATGGYPSASFPSSAYHTSIGGTTLALNEDSSIQFQLGWGVKYVQLTDAAGTLEDGVAMKNNPLAALPKVISFGGSGGGESRIFAKPRYQRKIKGNGRMLPDVSYQADGSTPLATMVTGFNPDGTPITTGFFWGNAGGTSLSCPMFSAIWAVANQRAGHSLGLAAPHLYRLSNRAIIDIVPIGSSTNVTGEISAGEKVTRLASLQLSTPQTYSPFYNAVAMNSLFDRNIYRRKNSWSVVSFDVDSTLVTAKGYDLVTGVGVPNGLKFIEEVFWRDAKSFQNR